MYLRDKRELRMFHNLSILKWIKAPLHDTICHIQLWSCCMWLSVHACKRRFITFTWNHTKELCHMMNENLIWQVVYSVEWLYENTPNKNTIPMQIGYLSVFYHFIVGTAVSGTRIINAFVTCLLERFTKIAMRKLAVIACMIVTSWKSRFVRAGVNIEVLFLSSSCFYNVVNYLQEIFNESYHQGFDLYFISKVSRFFHVLHVFEKW